MWIAAICPRAEPPSHAWLSVEDFSTAGSKNSVSWFRHNELLSLILPLPGDGIVKRASAEYSLTLSSRWPALHGCLAGS